MTILRRMTRRVHDVGDLDISNNERKCEYKTDSLTSSCVGDKFDQKAASNTVKIH